MKNISVRRLAQESGLPLAQATEVWQKLELSGFRSWKPWAVLIICQAGYWPLLLSTPHSFGLRFLQGLLFIGGLTAAVWVSRYLAYPRMLEEARRRVAEQAGAGHRGETQL